MFAESGETLIIGLAPDQTEAINEISIDFPEQKISHIDSSTDLPNVSAVYTKWQEQTFLTGVVAAWAPCPAWTRPTAKTWWASSWARISPPCAWA